ncbi:acyl-CoA dehydrogenase C-terminal domain-containing protein [Emcibacter sp. SYSU 3D8]|uniref:acyl-CoA dehydrogenase C-terminal domain-containing protein n=1 Tax=Emcibacter sp. SYSU 3D8 TaxID=3133969 RepID=UPI0031FF3FEC
MTTYTAPINDFKFVLNDVVGLDRYANLPGFEEVSPDLVDAILEEAGKVASEVLHPINQSGDLEGCHWDDGVVTTPKGFKEAYDLYVESGWGSLTAKTEHGGQGLPQTIAIMVSEMMIAANWGFTMYPGLTKSAVEALDAHASDELKERYLANMVSGKWTGTMNLTEPHCGTDLGMIRTKADPQADGSYRISGTKIFISAGEHDLSENIIHLVLAKIPGGPAGTKGISLFLVPKFLVKDDGSLGARNGVSCGSIEHKMGIHSNATCVMNYDEATGYLVGEVNRGMPAMFTMMNEARLWVGIQGLGIAEVAHQNAVAYARDRLQGRAISGPKNADGPADPIIVHPDVRRMLMTGRAFTEGARAMAAIAGLQIDLVHHHPDEAVRQKADDYVALMTPVIKAYFTDMGVDVASLAVQTWGGHGFIQDNGVEQFLRDSRIAPIYEGTNGIQAMDLVGRKLGMNGGRAIQAFFAEVGQFIAENKSDPVLGPLVAELEKALGRQQQATMWLMQNGLAKPDNAGAAASDYLRLMALVAMGHVWGMMAKAAQTRLAEGADNPAFYEYKLVTARFFFDRLLPDTGSLLKKIESGSESLMALPADAF